MASKATTPKAEAKPLSATERKAQVAAAEAAMKKQRPAFQAYRNADAHLRKAKQKGEAPQARHENAKDKNRKGHNAFMAAYTLRKRLLKQQA
jgi:hypothetical protein